MAIEHQSIDDWLNHRGTEKMGGGFLGNWKEDGHIGVWLHTKRLPISLWQHTFPDRVVVPDKHSGDPRVAFWGRPKNCHEDLTVLKKRYKRDRQTHERDVPPLKCPLCKLEEAVRRMIREERLSWTDKVFVFKGATEAKDNMVIHAGGLFGAFKGELDDDELEDLREHGIKRSEAWRENISVRENCVFVVVDNENPSDLQIATQPGLLGDKVKGVINDEIASKGDEGNPMLHPYCIEWIYRKDEAEFGKKYHARRIDRHKLTSEIAALIRSEPPDLTRVLEPFDATTMRSVLETYAVVDLPWDEIFGKSQSSTREPARSKVVKNDEPKPATEESREPTRRRRGKPVEEPKPKPIVKMLPCEECKAPMPETASKCEKCGAEYEVEDEPHSNGGEASEEDDGGIPF
jgi:hypothetical protein